MEDAYRLLLNNKLKDESFSDEIRRVFSKKRTKKLIDFFGILSDKEGEDILKGLEKSRKIDIKLDKKRIA
jgi:predicted CopG family antitoxin